MKGMIVRCNKIFSKANRCSLIVDAVVYNKKLLDRESNPGSRI